MKSSNRSAFRTESEGDDSAVTMGSMKIDKNRRQLHRYTSPEHIQEGQKNITPKETIRYYKQI